METLPSFLNVLIPLVIIMDPIGNLPFFLLFTEKNSIQEKRKMAAVASLTAFLILAAFAFTGDFILRFFDIGLPAFQLAGGFIFFLYSLQMLRLLPIGLKTTEEEKQEGIEKQNVALVPLGTPLLAGPGAITAVLVRRQGPEGELSVFLLLLAVLFACTIIYVVFRFSHELRNLMGVGGIRVLTRLMGLLLAVIAVQFMVSGFQNIK